MKFNICVAVPIKSGDLKQNETRIKQIVKENPEFIEFRFDYIKDIQRITPTFLKDLLNLIKPNISSIFTFRDSSEGGQIEVVQSERLKIITLLIEAQPQYLDIEMNTDRETLRKIINLANNNNVKLIFSYHNFEKTPVYEDGFNIIEKFKEKLLNNYLVDFKIIKKIIYKIIFTAQNFEDNLIPIKICKKFLDKEKTKRIICFCMGGLGIFSRITCVKAGSFLTYASLEDRTAPGQINVKLMREIHELLFFTDS